MSATLTPPALTSPPKSDQTSRLVPQSPASSPKRLARIAGLLWLLFGLVGFFAMGFVYPTIYVAGDVARTAANLVENAQLVRFGVVADLFQMTVWVLTAIALYQLLKHVNRTVAGTMVVFAAIGAGIVMLNTVFEFEALRVATGAVSLSSLGTAGSKAIVLLLVDAQHYGIFVAEIFFGLWLAPLGYLAYRSGWFPKALAIMLVVGCASYLADALAAFLLPDLSKTISSFIALPAGVAEIWMVGYLLVVGVKTEKHDGLPRLRSEATDFGG
jgi:hypothetical protein